MWPTFFVPCIPLQGGSETDCFNLYTKDASTTVNASAGAAIDPDLQFATVAGKKYWMYGRLVFETPDNSLFPGAAYGYQHSGDTLAFQGRDGTDLTEHATTAGVSQLVLQSASLADLGSTPVLEEGFSNATYIWVTTIDAVLIVGASGGTFGVRWGAVDTGAAGTVQLAAGSYISVLELEP